MLILRCLSLIIVQTKTVLGSFFKNKSQPELKSGPLSSSANSLLSQMLPVAELLIRNSLNNSPGFGKLSADPPHKICVYVAGGLAPLINTPEKC